MSDVKADMRLHYITLTFVGLSRSRDEDTGDERQNETDIPGEDVLSKILTMRYDLSAGREMEGIDGHDNASVFKMRKRVSVFKEVDGWIVGENERGKYKT